MSFGEASALVGLALLVLGVVVIGYFRVKSAAVEVAKETSGLYKDEVDAYKGKVDRLEDDYADLQVKYQECETRAADLGGQLKVVKEMLVSMEPASKAIVTRIELHEQQMLGFMQSIAEELKERLPVKEG